MNLSNNNFYNLKMMMLDELQRVQLVILWSLPFPFFSIKPVSSLFCYIATIAAA
jgi:hypothetical protein